MSEVLVPQQQAVRDNRAALSRSVLLIAVASFLFSLWASFVGFHRSLFDFRQTQTAISIEYMEMGGPFLRYETPVFGSPWSIPFEFPLYQKIVALISEHLRLPLEETGRTVSIAFFFLCFLRLWSILRRLRYTPVQVLAVLPLFAVSPLYIFFSRMVLIESTALFFSLMYVDMIIRLAIPAHVPRRPLWFSRRPRKGHNLRSLSFRAAQLRRGSSGSSENVHYRSFASQP